MNSLSEFWQKMPHNQAVHPDDVSILNSSHHTFNLDFPPPAFIGDIERAKVFVLFSNGGWDAIKTPLEFNNPLNAPEIFVERLHKPAAVNLGIVSNYYARSNMRQLIEASRLAIVNLIPYRSTELNKEPNNKCLAGELASSKAAIRFIQDIQRNRRAVIVIKRAIWRKFISAENVIENAGIGPHIGKDIFKHFS